jgi:hypothetical protein
MWPKNADLILGICGRKIWGYSSRCDRKVSFSGVIGVTLTNSLNPAQTMQGSK